MSGVAQDQFKNNTLINYKFFFTRLSDEFGDRELESITPDEILSFLIRLTEGTKQTTKRNRYSCLKAFFNYIRNTIDFEIQNPYDTPSKSSDRTFSSGCIRTENPFELAEISLSDPDKWNPESFKQVIDSGQTQIIKLPKSVLALLFYWTASVRIDGSVRLKEIPIKEMLRF